MAGRSCGFLWRGLVVILAIYAGLALPGCKPAPNASKTPVAAGFTPGPVSQQDLAGFWPCDWLQLPPGTQSHELAGSKRRKKLDWLWHELKGSGQQQDEIWKVAISSPLDRDELRQFFESQLAARQYRMAPHSGASSAEGDTEWIYIAPNCQDIFALKICSSSPGATIVELSVLRFAKPEQDLAYQVASPL